MWVVRLGQFAGGAKPFSMMALSMRIDDRFHAKEMGYSINLSAGAYSARSGASRNQQSADGPNDRTEGEGQEQIAPKNAAWHAESVAARPVGRSQPGERESSRFEIVGQCDVMLGIELGTMH